jgi:CheY-like chemotaxis protein
MPNRKYLPNANDLRDLSPSCHTSNNHAYRPLIVERQQRSACNGERIVAGYRGAPMSGLTGRRILIVEDEMLIALMLQGMLEGLGYHIAGRARTVADALAIIETNTQGIDAATLDINLAGEHANAVADALEAHGIPFIITTGYDNPKLFGFQGQPVLNKPFVPEQLEQAFHSLWSPAGSAC